MDIENVRPAAAVRSFAQLIPFANEEWDDCIEAELMLLDGHVLNSSQSVGDTPPTIHPLLTSASPVLAYDGASNLSICSNSPNLTASKPTEETSPARLQHTQPSQSPSVSPASGTLPGAGARIGVL